MSKYIALFCAFFLSGTLTVWGNQTATVTKVAETATEVRYTVADEDGIRQVTAQYAFVQGVTVVRRFSCPKSVTVAFAKSVQGTQGPEQLTALKVQDCAANPAGTELDFVHFFQGSGTQPFVMEYTGVDNQVEPTREEPTILIWEEWWWPFLLFIAIGFLIWLIWWWAFGPFRRR